jgi:bifunctional non-homologous end joining protein LigD
MSSRAVNDPAAVPAPLPGALAPQLLTSSPSPPADPSRWVFEIKYDGFRMMARVSGTSVRLLTRNGHDWTARLEPLRRDLARLCLPIGWYDGEIVVCDGNGRPDFGLLQRAFDVRRVDQIVFYVFDAPFMHGYDLRRVPLVVRRDLLQAAIPGVSIKRIQYSKELAGDPQDLLDAACRMGLEGIVAKRREGGYVSGRSRAWLKLKCGVVEDLVIVGYTRSKTGLGSLFLGSRSREGKLRYVGSAGTGLTELQRRGLLVALSGIEIRDCPLPGLAALGVRWVRPELLAEVRFSEWTHGGHLRHPVIKAVKNR